MGTQHPDLTVREVSRSINILGTSRLTVRIAAPPEAAWEQVKALFGVVQEADQQRGTFRGRVLGIARGMAKVAQQVSAAFAERGPDGCTVVFAIGIPLFRRGVDRKVFDDIVKRLQEPATPAIKPDWLCRQLAKGRTVAEAYSLPIGVFAVIAVLVFPAVMALVKSGAIQGDSAIGFASGVLNGVRLFVGPLLSVAAVAVGIRALGQRRLLGVVALAFGIASGYVWWMGPTKVFSPTREFAGKAIPEYYSSPNQYVATTIRANVAAEDLTVRDITIALGEDRSVTLGGVVPDSATWHRIQDIAVAIPGVTKVVNNMTLE